MTVTTTLARFFLAVDARDWDALERGLAPEVEVDYSSLGGIPAGRIAATELLGQWRGLLPGFDATQHLLGPIASDDLDDVACTVRAWHHLDDETWMVAGSYRMRVDASGRIAAIALLVSYQEGSADLADRARERAAAAA